MTKIAEANEAADGQSQLTEELERRVAELAEWFSDNPNTDDIADGIRCIVHDAILAERMGCAMACDGIRFLNVCDRNIANKCANVIRMRSNVK